MNIDNLIREIFKKNGSISKVDVSILIESILKKYFEYKNISFEDNKNSKEFQFDLILNNDFENFKSPCGIEVIIDLSSILTKEFQEKNNFKNDDSLQLKKLQSIVFNFINNDQFKSIIFITLLDEDSIKALENRLSEIIKNYKINILGKSFLNNIIAEIPEEVDKIISKLFSVKIQNLVFSRNENWKLKRDNYILNLSEQYKNSGKISLLLGAGVSCSANLPSWDELISSLFITYLINSHSDKKEYYGMGVNEYIESITQLSKNFSEKYLKSALLSARYLRTGFSSQTDNSIEFISELQQTLYKKEIKNSTLIQTIGKLCIPTRTGAKIRSIITYNFDNLIEQHLETINLKYKSIFLDNDKYENEELPIYHVHGYIPRNTNLKNNNSFEQMDLIFSEEGYHRMYLNPYHWSNLTQLSILKENICILIGLSMDDPNLRRLLEIAQTGSNNIRHYVFLKRINIKDISKSDSSIFSSNLETAFLERHHNLQELIFLELGVNIIWFEEFDELPKLLSQLLN
jgi:NAD-dependent SIR2 family protein deacetylase